MAESEGISRFVVLRHAAPDGVHWDLMLEHGPTLATWRLFREPIADDPHPIPAEPIGDHRRAYLEYEGPLSGNRGRVDRCDAGTCRILDVQPDHWRIEFAGTHLIGAYSLCASPTGAGREAAAGGGADGGGAAGGSANGLSSAPWLLRRLSAPR